jgi:hypothetical protein
MAIFRHFPDSHGTQTEQALDPGGMIQEARAAVHRGSSKEDVEAQTDELSWGIHVKSMYRQVVMFFWWRICPDAPHEVFEVATKTIIILYFSFGNNE